MENKTSNKKSQCSVTVYRIPTNKKSNNLHPSSITHHPSPKKSKHGNYIKEHGNSIKQVKYRIFILQGLKIHLSKD